MLTKFVIACFTVTFVTIVAAQTPQFQTLPYNPKLHRPNVIRGPYNLNLQRPSIIRGPYRLPSGANRPHVHRAKRDLFAGGQLSSNPNGGANALLQAGNVFGTKDHNLAGTVFAAGNTNGGPVSTGAGLSYNLLGNGLSVSKVHTPGVADITNQNAKINLFNNGPHNLDANIFKADTRLPNGFGFTKTGGNLDYNNANGFGGSLGVSRIPNFGTTYEAAAKANLWQSANRQTSLDLTGTASKINGGPFNGKINYGVGLGLNRFFG